MNIISITQAHRKTSHTIIESDDDSDIEMDDQGIITRTGTGTGASSSLVVTPGELITSDPTWMKGHGTYYLTSSSTTTTDENNNNNNSEMPTYSSLAGTIQKVNKLLTVVPFKGRYKPETGDHIIGRITGISVKRWKVDIGGERSATLLLGSVNLPGGVLRRKTEADELQMRSFLKEGDLVNCEVQNGGGDGGCMLHTRSLKYGKLRNGVFVKVPSGLIVRSKNHSFDLPGGVSIILGVNGFCWIGMTKRDGSGNSNSSGNVIGNNLKTEAGLTQKKYK
ncbi:hypothetical protein CANARDRAFT_176882 [[Candida] arabinofermentans NRRL YB-2248]|uniref:Uncharacterized protein n=1 Tax=[Candida] arabinofermentans NRRL YB-2248 TaxID=983967 RepID=A0A1E4SXT2_9ASCO|nr:hypothetical protein CANARDRAFT_176882 [[Candida] arabinofermentans NRRL YB-2248]